MEFTNLNQEFNFYTENLTTCPDSTILFVFIPTRPTAINIRTAIRKTWAKLIPKNVVVKFLIGKSQSNETQEKLFEEQGIKSDLILYDVEDTYFNLYIKVNFQQY